MSTLIVIIPMFLSAADLFWHTAEGMELLLRTLQASVQVVGAARTLVFTDTPHIFQVVRSRGLRSYLIDEDILTDQEYILPYGTDISLSYLHGKLKSNETNLMILDFTNPMITEELIRRAFEEFSRSKRQALVSVVRSTDHPCQLRSYYRIRDVAFMHCFDHERDINFHFLGPEPRSRYVTKSFRFDWKKRGVTNKIGLGLHTRSFENGFPTYPPFTPPQLPLTRCSIEAPLWLYEDSQTARLIVHVDLSRNQWLATQSTTPSPQLIGATFSYEDSSILAAVFKKEGEGGYMFFLSSLGEATGAYVLKACPIGPDFESDDRLLELEFSDFSLPIHFPWKVDGLHGILYCFMEVVNDDSYDLVNPFPSKQGLWHTTNGRIYNTITGMEILGRQDFPPVFEIDGSIFITSGDAVNHLEKAISEGRAAAFTMPADAVIHIKSPLDVLLYRVRTSYSLPVSVPFPSDPELFSSQFLSRRDDEL